MKKTTNDCCECAVPGYPCLGPSCPRLAVTHTFCDTCGEEADEMFAFDGHDYCPGCLCEKLVNAGIIDRIPAPEL